jgi:outer membrane protein assembly factor BamB
VIVGDKLVLLAGHCVIGIERDSGREVWRRPYRHPAYASPIAAKIGDADILICPNGTLLRAEDGAMITDRVDNHDGECASPILDGDRFFLISRAGFACVDLPKEMQTGGKPAIRYAIEPVRLDPEGEIYCVGSPLYYQGLVYAIRSGWGGGQHTPTLFVIEADTGQLVYRQSLDFDVALFYDPKGGGAVASVTLAGKQLYVMNNRGTTIVFKPGRRFIQEAKNTIQHLYTRENVQEVTNSTPIFEGRRMYYRGLQNLYCIGNETKDE